MVHSTRNSYRINTRCYRFAVLTKIMKFMKARYKSGYNSALTIDEIFEKANLLNIPQTIKVWLVMEGFVGNPRIEFLKCENKYNYVPIYNINDEEGLMNVLKQCHEKCLGGIFLDEIENLVPNLEEILRKRAEELKIITRTRDKRKILFYNDTSLDIEQSRLFRKYWNSITTKPINKCSLKEKLRNLLIKYN